jgi:general secretion pathway protein K
MNNRRGFALMVALWLVVLLGSVALAASVAARERRRAVIAGIESGRADAAAQAGLQHALAEYAAALKAANRRGLRDAREVPWQRAASALQDLPAAPGLHYRVTIDDPGHALHLNRASETELQRLFTAVRIDAGEADRLAQAIADWRDGDQLHRARGAERDNYLAAGAPVLPADGPFTDLEELRFVRGMTPRLLGRVLPYLTLDGGGLVNLNAAGRPVLLALPGMTEEMAALILRRRQAEPIRDLNPLVAALSPSARSRWVAHTTELAPRITLDTREVLIRSEGWGDPGAPSATVEGLVAAGADEPFLVLVRSR